MYNSRIHEEIGGGYTMGPKIVIDTAEIFPGKFETMALNTVTGDELGVFTDDNLQDAAGHFAHLIQRHAEPRQAAFFRAGMIPGKRYTIAHMTEFGFPAAYQFTFLDIHCATFAQHRDVIELRMKRAGKRKEETWKYYEGSFLLYDGWRELPEHFGYELCTNTPELQTWKSKYHCFDAGFFEDLKNLWPDYIAVYENVRTGANGKRYA